MAAFKIFRKFADLLDRSTVDLPSINTPIADALAAKAASADLSTVATSGSYADLSGTPTVPTTVAELSDVTIYDFATLNTPISNALAGKATAAQGALADSAVQEGDSPSFGAVTASGTVTAAGATFNGLVSQTGLGGSTYFGEGAGVSDDLSANDNVGVGFQALKSNTTGYRNTASGNSALYNNTTGYRNTASGNSALYRNTTGSLNTASGNFALYNNATGSNNTASGNSALYRNTEGINNTASGYQALYANTTGGNNTASGFSAGRYIADGTTANETSGTSVYIGADTKAFANGDANEIVIGYNAIGAGSNSVVLGNDSITTTVLRGDVETNGTVTTGAYTVATLPTPATGMRAYVTDSNVTASGNFGATVAAGGSNIVPVFYDGTNWIIA